MCSDTAAHLADNSRARTTARSNEGKGIDGFIESEKDESRRARIADVAYGHLNTIFDNPEKGAIQHSMIHRLLRDYLTISASLPDNEKRREAFFNGCVFSHSALLVLLDD